MHRDEHPVDKEKLAQFYYRILYKEDGKDTYFVLALCMTDTEAGQNWNWLETDILPKVCFKVDADFAVQPMPTLYF